jgi:alpha-L-fucosidase
MVIDMLVDIVSKNGNLMLNVPLPASGMPDPEELAVVEALTRWMNVNSEGIHGTRPWRTFGEGAPVQTADQNARFANENSRRELGPEDVRFTTKAGVLYAFVMGRPKPATVIRSLASGTGAAVGKVTSVELLGREGPLDWIQDGSGLLIRPPESAASEHASCFRIRGALA